MFDSTSIIVCALISLGIWIYQFILFYNLCKDTKKIRLQNYGYAHGYDSDNNIRKRVEYLLSIGDNEGAKKLLVSFIGEQLFNTYKTYENSKDVSVFVMLDRIFAQNTYLIFATPNMPEHLTDANKYVEFMENLYKKS